MPVLISPGLAFRDDPRFPVPVPSQDFREVGVRMKTGHKKVCSAQRWFCRGPEDQVGARGGGLLQE